MSMSITLVHEVNDEIGRAIKKWGKIDKDPHEMLNGVTEELLEVVHAVNHREGPARVHEEIIHAIGVLVRLDEMQQSNKSFKLIGGE